MKRRSFISMANIFLAGPALAKASSGETQPTAPQGPFSSLARDWKETYGLIGDNKSHPLSEKFADLNAAKAVYPHAQAMSDEIDWCAIQAAVNACEAAGGGTVELPTSSCHLNRKIVLPRRSIHWNEWSPPGVNLKGQGKWATRLIWRKNIDDAAIGIAAVEKDYLEQADILISDLSMAGPGNYMHTKLGENFTNFDGIKLPDRMALKRITISGFRAGISFNGGQAHHQEVAVENCYYALYGRERNKSHHGDMRFTKCWFSGLHAAIGMHPTAGLFASFNTTFLGGTPYVIFKEAGDGRQTTGEMSPHQDILVQGSIFQHCQFEKIGNGLFQDGNAERKLAIRDVTLDHCFYLASDEFRLPDSLSKGLIDCQSVERFELSMPHDPYRWPKRSEFISAPHQSSVVIEALL